MVDTATMLREQIYSAVRAFTCATVAEAGLKADALLKEEEKAA